MKGTLICNGFLNNPRFDVLYQMLEEAFQKYDIQLERCYNNKVLAKIRDKISLGDFVLFWDKDVLLAKHLENNGYQVFNSAKAIEICDDKGLTAITLENSNIKMPKTILAPFKFDISSYNDFSFVDEVINYLKLPLVIKENKGSFGMQVTLAKTEKEIISILENTNHPVIFQEFIKSSFGRDVRVEVVGGKAIGAVERHSQEGEFRSNVLLGGSMIKANVPDSFLKLAEEVSKTIGLDFCGVDIMFGNNNEPIFCEVNSNVHFKTFYSTTGINLADEIAKYIINKINR